MKLNQVTRILKGVSLVTTACSSFAVHADAIDYVNQSSTSSASQVSLTVNSIEYLLDAGTSTAFTSYNNILINSGFGAYSSALISGSPVSTETVVFLHQQ